ncbi:MAG: hypothetical protein Harvfovirus46_2 [Harvfovirus sp.]|uniref:Uncharacterized protein n=1 Tax=Harvfovirus sp. TaxID=2487768 RepID=A0A3G5A8C9_9VIRU|nr:MAG: hypothetical protein Harvfovirus46_2 [Harvfovirus sp.]
MVLTSIVFFISNRLYNYNVVPCDSETVNTTGKWISILTLAMCISLTCAYFVDLAT